jgi:hypothetical protein
LSFLEKHGVIAAVILASGAILAAVVGAVFGKTTGLIAATVTTRVTATQTVTQVVTHTVTQSGTVVQAKARASAVYLSDRQPQGGDIPMRGDTQIGNQDFPHSIFYDNVPGNQSNASACQNVGDPTCQATDYSIAAARYHQFSAMLGVTGCSGDTAHWSLSVDSVVVKSGPVAVNSSPQGVSVAIPSGNSLELLMSTSGFSGAACGAVNIVWGNAQLR